MIVQRVDGDKKEKLVTYAERGLLTLNMIYMKEGEKGEKQLTFADKKILTLSIMRMRDVSDISKGKIVNLTSQMDVI